MKRCHPRDDALSSELRGEPVGAYLQGGQMVVELAVRRAAVLFVRNALLYEGASHYALLGLERSADAAEIKSRYVFHKGDKRWPSTPSSSTR